VDSILSEGNSYISLEKLKERLEKGTLDTNLTGLINR
jgi:hypothetical protein